MLSIIVVGIDRGILEPEVRAQIDHYLASLQRRSGILSRNAMGQG